MLGPNAPSIYTKPKQDYDTLQQSKKLSYDKLLRNMYTLTTLSSCHLSNFIFKCQQRKIKLM